MKTLLATIIAIFALISFSGCGASGARFSRIEAPTNAQNAMLYIYRTNAFMGSGRVYDIYVEYDGVSKPLGGMRSNGYFKVEVPAERKVSVWSPNAANLRVAIDTKAGQTHCVKFGVTGDGILDAYFVMAVVDQETCQREIVETREQR